MDGSRFVVRPIERDHSFRHNPDNDFLCLVCDRPRCLHSSAGFIPKPSLKRGNEDAVNMDPYVRYGRHPRWFRPGTLRLNRAEQEAMDKKWGKR